MVKRGTYLTLLALIVCLFVPSVSDAVVTSEPFVTDVTPVHFSVVWTTSEPTTASVSVFLDAEGTIPYIEAVVHSESADHPPAEDIGVMKVRVLNLKPDSTYFFQTKSVTKGNNTCFLYPNSPPFPELKTEKETIVVSNDVLARQVLQSDGSPAMGTMLIAEVEGSSYPITGWVGDGVPAPWALVNLDNIYSKTNHKNLELAGSGVEDITFTAFGGILGSLEILETVPRETGGTQPIQLAATLPGSSSQDSGTGEGSGSGGSSCFIATAAFGSAVEPHVEFLKTFKHRFDVKYSIGRELIKQYYRHSPRLTEYIKKHIKIKLLVRYSLLPVVYSVYLYKEHGTILIYTLLSAIIMFIYIRSVHIKSYDMK